MAHFNVSGFYRRTLKLSKRTAEKSVTWTFKRVIISIPAHMRYLYNGTQRDKRKSTFTSDEGAAQRLHHGLAQQIYDEFDQKQNEHLTKHHDIGDNFAADTIYGLATSFNYKNIPDLKSSTEYTS